MNNDPNGLDFEDACRYLWPRPEGSAGRRARWPVAARPPDPWSSRPTRARPWHGGRGPPPWRPGWPGVGSACASGRRGARSPRWRRLGASNAPWGPGRFSPRRWHCTWGASPARVPIAWAAACRRGMARNWPSSASRRPSSRPSRPPRCGGCWRSLTCSLGVILWGALPNRPEPPPAMPPSLPCACSTRVHGVRRHGCWRWT